MNEHWLRIVVVVAAGDGADQLAVKIVRGKGTRHHSLSWGFAAALDHQPVAAYGLFPGRISVLFPVQRPAENHCLEQDGRSAAKEVMIYPKKNGAHIRLADALHRNPSVRVLEPLSTGENVWFEHGPPVDQDVIPHQFNLA
jgi:hypothetical protein